MKHYKSGKGDIYNGSQISQLSIIEMETSDIHLIKNINEAMTSTIIGETMLQESK